MPSSLRKDTCHDFSVKTPFERKYSPQMSAHIKKRWKFVAHRLKGCKPMHADYRASYPDPKLIDEFGMLTDEGRNFFPLWRNWRKQFLIIPTRQNEQNLVYISSALRYGQLIGFDDNSGHYRPTSLQVIAFANYLSSNGIDLIDVNINLYGSGIISAEDVLSQYTRLMIGEEKACVDPEVLETALISCFNEERAKNFRTQIQQPNCIKFIMVFTMDHNILGYPINKGIINHDQFENGLPNRFAGHLYIKFKS